MELLGTIESALIARARERSRVVLPCGRRARLEDCFSLLPSGEVILWWNDATGSTRIERSSALEIPCRV